MTSVHVYGRVHVDFYIPTQTLFVRSNREGWVFFSHEVMIDHDYDYDDDMGSIYFTFTFTFTFTFLRFHGMEWMKGHSLGRWVVRALAMHPLNRA